MKKVLIPLFAVLLFVGCRQEEAVAPTEPRQIDFPDPSFEDVYWDIAIENTNWNLDSVVMVQSAGNAFQMTATSFEKGNTTLKFDDRGQYEWNKEGQVQRSTYLYDNRSLTLTDRVFSLRAVVINLNENLLSFCYNTSSQTSDRNSREMYFFSAQP